MGSLQHILASDPGEPDPVIVPSSAANAAGSQSRLDASTQDTTMAEISDRREDDDGVEDHTQDLDSASMKRGSSNAPKNGVSNEIGLNPSNGMGGVSSVYSGNKIKHLKKEDGIPLWRKDIQYDFLCGVFYNEQQCFTRASDGSKGHTFAEVYIDAMAKSSKTSRILKEKLLQDQDGAISMAMVCLLVNVGRMNTTLNFFPEMRAQLRTYHSIPALQARQDPNAYKQLQDAPRLKSILKGATEDDPQPTTIEAIQAASIPRTNPVNLIFVMSQYAPKITETHFQAPRDFFDLVMRTTLSSASRARAFLWLIWWYLESDFTHEGTQQNPFGKGQYGEGEEGTDVLPTKVPNLESLTEEQAALENLDTPVEKEFGDAKRRERISILASDPSPAMTALKRARREKGLGGFGLYGSDDERSDAGTSRPSELRFNGRLMETGSEYTRSPSPPVGRASAAANSTSKSADVRIHELLNDEMAGEDSILSHTPSGSSKKATARNNGRRSAKPIKTEGSRAGDSSQPIPLLPNAPPLNFVDEAAALTSAFQFSGGRDHVPTPSYQTSKRSRGMTQHQSAVINHRRMQIEYMLDRRIRELHDDARKWRLRDGAVLRAWKRIRQMPIDYDSDEEEPVIGRRSTRDSQVDVKPGWRPTETDGLDMLEEVPNHRTLMAGVVRTRGDMYDVGEEYKAYSKAFQKMLRRIHRWSNIQKPGQVMRQRQSIASRPRPPRRSNTELEKSMPRPEPLPLPARSRGGNSRKSAAKSGGRATPRPSRSSKPSKRSGNARRPARASEIVLGEDAPTQPEAEVEAEFGEEASMAVDLDDDDDDDRDMLAEIDGDGDDSEMEDEDERMADE